MKTAEEFVSKWSNWWITNNNKNVLNRAFENELKEIIEQAQKDAYNQAINDAAKEVDKESILKLKKMKYLIIYTDPITGEVLAFYTNWFNPENHFNADCDMIVVDRTRHLFTIDGEEWSEIEEDHL